MKRAVSKQAGNDREHRTRIIHDGEPRAWLPRMRSALAPRLHALLEPDSLAADAESAELLVQACMEDALRGRATDIHFEPMSAGCRIRFRIDGHVHDAAQTVPAYGEKMIRFLRVLAALDPVASHKPQDAAFQYGFEDHKVDVRLSCAPCQGGVKLVLRLLDPQRVQRRLQDLGLSTANLRSLKRWTETSVGMCLLTGPTGCGKTTTLYALLHEMELSDFAVVTIEDPIEVPVNGLTQMQVNPPHELTFATGLKAMLRLDPDYLVVGEMRDAASAQTAVEAAASGHYVMSTLHSSDAAGAVTLLRGWGLLDHQIANVLQTVVNQRLVRRLCPKCRRATAMAKEDRMWLRSLRLPPPNKVYHAPGCAACQGTGYHERIGVFEVWQKAAADYSLILAHADEHKLRRNLRRRGLKTVLEDGLAKARKGITSLYELRQMGAHLE
jgi:general secretion pathway protein E